MPLEIRELVIKATVNNNSGGSSATSGGNKKEADINEVVAKVLEIIKEKSER